MIVHFFYIIVGALGLVTTSIIFSYYKKNRVINIYLILLFTIISLKFVFDGLLFFKGDLLPNFSYMPFLSVVFPLQYLYFKNIVFETKKLETKELWHFVFPLFLGFFNILNNNIHFLGKHTLVILNLVFTTYSILYLATIFKFLKINVWYRKSKIKIVDTENTLLRKWTLFLFILLFLGGIRLLLTLFIDLVYNDFSYGKNNLWITGVFWLFILIKILISPEILFGYNALYKKMTVQKKSDFILKDIWNLNEKIEIKNQQDHLLNAKIYPDLTKYLKDIEHLALVEKWFRKPKTSGTEIAKKLDIPKSHLKFIFKYHSKVSFTEFKKIIKTYDAMQLIESDFLKINTLDALAMKVGFSSYNPFFTSFKEITGSTPQAYSKEIARVKKQK
ncbi:AraC family transcriptional regulator [Flavobacterium sp.]|uniref:helix-turn-helix domain-containing protein n=1 Tax=Flavobacterium sp. TaxID=239 RepID=UPI001B653DA4|nr:AraC family transcriptional regulator [Flavobacterium sp.]MBP6128448.1 helix-turn-helix transcriptional regulator [Flavobacterium sp.]